MGPTVCFCAYKTFYKLHSAINCFCDNDKRKGFMDVCIQGLCIMNCLHLCVCFDHENVLILIALILCVHVLL